LFGAKVLLLQPKPSPGCFWAGSIPPIFGTHCVSSCRLTIDECWRVNRQEAQLMLTNPRDALSQSRSPNTVPFHMLGISILLVQ